MSTRLAPLHSRIVTEFGRLSHLSFSTATQGTKHTHSSSSSPSRQKTKSNGPVKTRFFDEHTISIWAQNMVKRGGEPTNAIQMILNRMDSGKAHHTTELYNSALDICGHFGLLSEAASILHKMIAKNVRTDERTVSSLLNAMAEHARTLPLWGKDTPTEVSTASETEETATLPAIEAFALSTKEQAVKLAIKVYASWVEHSLRARQLPVEPFNALLKVLWRCQEAGAKVLPRIFPHQVDAKSGTWIPNTPDVISYTTAILAAQYCPERPFDTAFRYWTAFLASKGSWEEMDSKMMLAMLVALQKDLFGRAKAGPLHMDKELILSRREFLEKIMTRCQEMPAVNVRISNVLLNVAGLLGCYQKGIEYWKAKCAPLLQGKASMRAVADFVNEETVANYVALLSKSDQQDEALNLVTHLMTTKSLLMNAAIYNILLFIHRKRGDHEAGKALIEKHLRRLRAPINTEVVFQTIALYHELFPRVQAQEMIGKTVEWLEQSNHRPIWEKTKQKNYIATILKKHRMDV